MKQKTTTEFKTKDFSSGTIRRIKNNAEGDVCEISAYEKVGERYFLRYIIVPTEALKKVIQ